MPFVQAGYEAKGFANASDFFAACKEHVPELVLLDIMLPEVDGLEILHVLREDAAMKHVPIMMLTAKGTEYDTVCGLDAGADDYLAKPFGMMEELVSRVNALLRRASAPSGSGRHAGLGPITLAWALHGACRWRAGDAHAEGVRPAASAHAERGSRAVAQPAAGRRVGHHVRRQNAYGRRAYPDVAAKAGCGVEGPNAWIHTVAAWLLRQAAIMTSRTTATPASAARGGAAA